MPNSRSYLFRPLIAGLLLLTPVIGFTHGKPAHPSPSDREIQFPDVPGALTLVTDLHTHTVFSDGHVWPGIRVEEALRDGLDALAVTEHLEYQPHRADLPHPDRNRALAETVAAAEGSTLIIVNGSEITREEPAGHMNAVFITDSNALLKLPAAIAQVRDPIEVYRAAHAWPAEEAVKAASAQGGFVFWNHSWWKDPGGNTRLDPFHAELIRSKDLHGIEVANGDTYSAEAHQVALDNGLAMIGVSDVHDLIDWDYPPHAGSHRPVTLVFAAARTSDALREALFAKRTVVWFRNLLIGREAELLPLLNASLTLAPEVARHRDTEVVEVTLRNSSDAEFQLQNTSAHTFVGSADLISVPQHGETKLLVKSPAGGERIKLTFKVLNALLAPGKPASIDFSIEQPPAA